MRLGTREAAGPACVLSVDTSSEHASVALVSAAADLRVSTWTAAGAHSRELMSRIDALFGEAGLALSDLNVLVAVSGPGSFTGLRVGLAAIQGLSMSSGLPCYGVSALRAMAEAAPRNAGPILAARQGYREDVFAQTFAEGRPLHPPLLVKVNDLAILREHAPALLIGDGVQRYEEVFHRLFPDAQLAPMPPLALAAARLGARNIEDAGPAATLEPLYIRPVDIGVPKRG